MENRELKPCPFCGWKASVSQGCSLWNEPLGKGQYEFVSCDLCGSRTTRFFHSDYGTEARNEAINAWNRRVNDET